MARRFTAEGLIDIGRRFFSFFLALYLIFLLGRAIYFNFRVKQRITAVETDIKELKTEIARLNNRITYYQTETFRELEARRQLGLKKPGEIVVSLPENSDEEQSTGGRKGIQEEELPEKPNYVKWWEYLFGEE